MYVYICIHIHIILSKLYILDKDTVFEIFFFFRGRSHTFISNKNIRLVHSW